MMDYKCAKLYAIVGEDGMEVYVGSTCSPLYKRWWQHQHYAKKYPNRDIYKYISENGGCEKFRIILVEEYPCENRDQLRRREGEHIKKLNPVGNHLVAGRTKQEYYKDNQETILEKQRQYHEQNSETINEKKRQYYEQNPEYWRQYHEQNREKQRQYYEQNREKLNEKQRQYREQNPEYWRQYHEQNREKLNEKQRQYRLRKKLEKQKN